MTDQAIDPLGSTIGALSLMTISILDILMFDGATNPTALAKHLKDQEALLAKFDPDLETSIIRATRKALFGENDSRLLAKKVAVRRHLQQKQKAPFGRRPRQRPI
jgi:hypothetical protein